MKVFNWNCEKNAWLKANQGISFEEIIFHIELGGELAITHHPDAQSFAENGSGRTYPIKP